MLLLITTIITALSAGVFFAWSCSVTPGLRLLSDATYFDTFRSLNKTIQNPMFFTVFFGAAILLPLTAGMNYGKQPQAFWLMISASACYLFGVMAVTIFGNIPLNLQIDSMDTTMNAASLKQYRIAIESSWNRLNLIRTFSATTALILCVIACFTNKNV